MRQIRQWIVKHEVIVAAGIAILFGLAIVFCTGCSHRIQKILLKPGEDVTIHTPLIDYEVTAEDNTGAIIEEIEKGNGKIQIK